MNIRDGSLKRILYATSPLLLWAAHWALMYLLAVLHAGRAGMMGLSLAAIGAAGWLLWHATRRRGARTLVQLALAANAVLAVIAIAWTCVPLLLMGGPA